MICPKCGHVSERRSDPAHGLLRAWNRILANHFGNSEGAMLDIIFERCGLVDEGVNPFTGEIRYSRMSTKDLTDEQCSRVLDEMNAIAIDYMGGALPHRSSSGTFAGGGNGSGGEQRRQREPVAG